MPRALIVDDAAFVRGRNARVLLDNGFQVYEACNGLEAVAKYAQLNPDIVLMDITMPQMDGIQAVKAIKAKYPDAKVIMCTALGQQSLVMEAIRAGAKDFLVKPFPPESLLLAVNRQIG